MIPTHILAKPIPIKSIFELTPNSVEKDWFGNSVRSAPRFWVALTTDRLLFGASVSAPPYADLATRPGTFVEGLWEKDLAELFLGEDGSGRYQEFNLSPAGAWWSHSFSEYRVRDTANFKRPKGVETFAEHTSNSWRAAISIPLTDLSINLKVGEKLNANVTFILESPKQKFLSFLKPEAGEPDFHSFWKLSEK